MLNSFQFQFQFPDIIHRFPQARITTIGFLVVGCHHRVFRKNLVDYRYVLKQREFYEEVVYAEKGPGAEAYQKYYETIDPSIMSQDP